FSNLYKLKLMTLPKGDKGDTGAKGADGDSVKVGSSYASGTPVKLFFKEV
ncbi:hypothetical protein GND98_019290, partial [Clostridium butyricum]|nr:hypothetical protein [Clostridium butyricum]